MSTYAFAAQAGPAWLDGRVTLPDPPPPMLVGVDCTAADLPTTLKQHPAMAYHRVFDDHLPPLTAGKMAALPTHVIPHVSWKVWDPAALDTWLSALNRTVWLTYYHEPSDNIDGVTWRAVMRQVVDMAARHPLVGHLGPVLSTSYVDEQQRDPREYWVDGCTRWDGDRYNRRAKTYRSPGELFEPIAKVGEYLEVPWGVPEFGGERIASDITGEGRAQWMRSCFHYLNTVGCSSVAWWDIGGCKLTAHPELATLQTIVHGQRR